jgi:hypothetical protein
MDDLQPAPAFLGSGPLRHPCRVVSAVVDLYAQSERTEDPGRKATALSGMQDAVVQKFGRSQYRGLNNLGVAIASHQLAEVCSDARDLLEGLEGAHEIGDTLRHWHDMPVPTWESVNRSVLYFPIIRITRCPPSRAYARDQVPG